MDTSGGRFDALGHDETRLVFYPRGSRRDIFVCKVADDRCHQARRFINPDIFRHAGVIARVDFTLP